LFKFPEGDHPSAIILLDQKCSKHHRDWWSCSTERDKVIRKDAGWREAATGFLELKRQAEALALQVELAKESLVTRFWKLGNVAYKKVPELKGLDLSAYRAAARE
jgi:hypothetical protein